MQMPDHTDGPGGDAFLAWAQEQGLQPDLQDQAGQRRLTLTGSSGLTRPVEPGTWVIVQRDARGQVFIETCTPEYFADMFEPARSLRVETYRSGTTEVPELGETEHAHVPTGPIEYRWRVRHTSNGEIMASGEGYTDRRARDHAIQVLWPDLPVIEAVA
jgi:hypothetical protein